MSKVLPSPNTMALGSVAMAMRIASFTAVNKFIFFFSTTSEKDLFPQRRADLTVNLCSMIDLLILVQGLAGYIRYYVL